MRKIRLLLVLALVLFIPVMASVKADTKEKITVYFFRGEGCPHCAEAEEFFADLAKDDEYSNYYNLKDYEVWYDEKNSAFMEKVAKALDTEVTGVPFIVIGDKYFSGYSASMSENIKDTIKTAYEDKEYTDVVASVENGKEVKKNKEESSPLIPIIIVSVIAVGTIAGLIFLTKEK